MYTHEDIMVNITMHFRVSTPEATEFKTRLGFNQHDLIMTKEQSVLAKISKIFANEEILLQHSVLTTKFIYTFLSIDQQQKLMKKGIKKKSNRKKLVCEFIRINPYRKDFDLYVEIGKIYNHIKELTKSLTKESLIDKISKRLLDLGLKSHHSIKSNCLKRIVKHMLLTL